MKNYRPVSVLPTLSKIEQLMQMEISKYINQFLSPFLHSYRQGFSTQTALICLIEKCKWYLDENSFAVAILMDLSKALDTINWDFLNCETSYGYGFGKNVLGLVYSYLKNRKQRVKINSILSIYTDLISGVPERSVRGPLLFYIYLNDLFFFLQDINICNFADDTTPFVCNKTLESVLDELEGNSNCNHLFWKQLYETKHW